MSSSPQADLPFFRHLCRHIGLLVVRYQPVDRAGKGQGELQTLSSSGFFIVLDEQWYFVTVGHVFQRDPADGLGIEQALARNAIRIEQAIIADYFGPNAQDHGGLGVPLPTVIDYQTVMADAIYVNDAATGLDYALLPLREFYVRGLQANGIVPLTELQWQPMENPPRFVVVGFPDEEKTPGPSSTSTGAAVRPCYLCIDPTALPPGTLPPSLPYLAARLPSEGPHSAVGFSGSPIFAIQVLSDPPRTEYLLVGIDHKWYPRERVIVGCRLVDVVADFRRRRTQVGASAGS